MKRYRLHDPFTDKPYDYIIRDDKEQKLLDALNYVLDDACPPDKEDYLCQADESEQQRCKDCWIRWATKDHCIGG